MRYRAQNLETGLDFHTFSSLTPVVTHCRRERSNCVFFLATEASYLLKLKLPSRTRQMQTLVTSAMWLFNFKNPDLLENSAVGTLSLADIFSVALLKDFRVFSYNSAVETDTVPLVFTDHQFSVAKGDKRSNVCGLSVQKTE